MSSYKEYHTTSVFVFLLLIIFYHYNIESTSVF